MEYEVQSPDLLETGTSRLPIPGSSSPNTLNLFHLRLGAEKKDPKRRIRVPEVFLTVVRPKPTTTAVVKGCTQLHSDGLTFVPKHRTQPSLSTPPCGPACSRRLPASLSNAQKNKGRAHLCEPCAKMSTQVVVVVVVVGKQNQEEVNQQR